MKRLSTALLLGLLAAACSGDEDVRAPRSFDRPTAVAFACFEQGAGQFRPLSSCQDTDNTQVSLTALVTQSARGEVAAVDLRRNKLIDSDIRVPGYTFEKVGEVPVAIVVPPAATQTTFVASFGSRRLEAIPTWEFRPDAARDGRRTQTFEILTDGNPTPAAPIDMVLSSDGTQLYVALPDRGALAAVAISADPTMPPFGAATIVALDATVPPPVADVAGRPYQQVCAGQGFSVKEPRLVAPRADTVLGTTPEPVDLAVDVATGRVFVADASLPVIHAFSPDLSASIAIDVGVPTTALAVTPPVPAYVPSAEEPPAPLVQYLYAIDATDGSVLVVDVTEGSPEFGAVQSVGVGQGAVDRVMLFAPARTLEVVTPGYPGEGCASEGLRPDRLRGVFLSVGLIDGTVRIVDVYDLDAPCRAADTVPDDGTTSTAGCQFDSAYGPVFVRRHRPRIGAVIRKGVSLVGPVTVALQGTGFGIDEVGEVDADVPGLLPLGGSCFGATTFAQVYPETDGAPTAEALICAVSDPWAARTEQWIATWEGLIPGTAGGLGRWTTGDPSGAQMIASDAAFCARGVLGSTNVALAAVGETDPLVFPEVGYGGDALIITSEIPEASADVPECATIAAYRDNGGIVGFEIDESFANKLVLGAPLSPVGPTLAQVQACFVELFTYEVRTDDAFTVLGSQSGFLHRVEADESTGRCVFGADAFVSEAGLPLDPDRFVNGRAFPGAPPTTMDGSRGTPRPFINPQVAFAIEPLPAGIQFEPDEIVLQFALGDAPPVQVLDISDTRPSVPETLVWSAVDQRLYLIDIASRGLVQIRLDPFELLRAFE